MWTFKRCHAPAPWFTRSFSKKSPAKGGADGYLQWAFGSEPTLDMLAQALSAHLIEAKMNRLLLRRMTFQTPYSAMQSDVLTLSRRARAQHPYRSLQAAVLFQSFRDAVSEISPIDEPTDREEVHTRRSNRQTLESCVGFPKKN